jgi:hypothetical protein
MPTFGFGQLAVLRIDINQRKRSGAAQVRLGLSQFGRQLVQLRQRDITGEDERLCLASPFIRTTQ